MTDELILVTGGCHCGAVRFDVRLPRTVIAHRCNCSICAATGFVHLIVPKSSFQLTSSEEALTVYTFNTHTARHYFCKVCGVKSFYVPRSNPDGYSVNLNCVDHAKFQSVSVEDFDGQNWEQNAGSLAHLSQDSNS